MFAIFLYYCFCGECGVGSWQHGMVVVLFDAGFVLWRGSVCILAKGAKQVEDNKTCCVFYNDEHWLFVCMEEVRRSAAERPLDSQI